MYEQLRHGAASPVIVDTSVLVALFHDRDQHVAEARAFFDGVRSGRLRARPLYTSEYVVDELATTLLSRTDHDRASQAVASVRESTLLHVLHVDEAAYELAADRFIEYDDRALSFTDHVIGVQATDRGVDVVLSFDGEFTALGLTTLPE